MKIAFISYEFPPETAYGGVATYVFQATKMLAERGNHVEVFCPSLTKDDYTSSENGLLVHRIKSNRENFNKAIVAKFTERHNEIKFDLVESPEYGADGLEVFKKFPQLTSIIKTHTPTYLLEIINPGYEPDTVSKIKMVLGAVRRFNLKLLDKKPYLKEQDEEYHIAQQAHFITTPSKSLGEIVAKDWHINKKKIILQPYPYVPTQELLDIEIKKPATKNVTFVGRLEIRKGLVILKDAIPQILKQDPEIIFNFVGRPMYSPNPRYNMEEYLKHHLKDYQKNLKFHGLMNLSSMAEVLKTSAVCVFPSIWENFPNVCLESMSAGRAIVGTYSGGMAEQLADGAGVLIPPSDAGAITDAVLKLIKDPDLCVQLGKTARKKVLEVYNSKVIGDMMESQYQSMINQVHGKS
jgi:glycosyltransferase involved in cell wall biosynthesis